jgi:YD repeat-containing protein
MASYLDNIPTFNEYVEQRPVDDMLKAGLYKQQRYEEGVQKIQDSIDNIAGLDVIRDIDKQYLQSKLNALGGQLADFAASDFSNFQLVNSVNGMTKQLASDPVILNAVGSSSAYRKQLESMQKIDADGKGSDSNRFIFNEAVNSWLNGDINTRFDAVYKPYVNYQDQALDIVKALVQADNPQVTDVAFDYDENGNVIAIRDAITKIKIEGISAAQIQSALQSGLTADAFQQMANDGRFNYAGVEAESFADDLNSAYTETFNQILAEKTNLEGILASAQEGEEKLRIQQDIEALDRQANMLRAEYQDVSSTFSTGDVESAKAKLYTTNWLKNFSNSHQNIKKSVTFETSPFKTVQLKQEEMRYRRENDLRNYLQRNQQHEERMEIENQKLDLLKNPYGPVDLGFENLKDKTNPEVIALYEADVEASLNLAEQSKNNILNKYNLTEDTLKDMLIAVAERPQSVRFDLREDLISYSEIQQNANRNADILAGLRTEAENIYPEAQMEGNKSFTFRDGTPGSYLEFSKIVTEIFEPEFQNSRTGDGNPLFNEADIERGYKLFGVPGDFNGIDNALLSKYFDIYVAGFKDSNYIFGNPFAEEYGMDGDKFKNIFYDVNDFKDDYREGPWSDVLNQRNEYIATELKRSNMIVQPVSIQIPLRNTEEIRTFKGVVGNLIQDDAARDGQSEENLIPIIDNLQSANVVKMGDGNYKLRIVGKTNKAELKLSPAQYQSIFRGRFDEPPNIAAFNRLYLPSMLDTRPPLTQNQFTGEWSREPQTFYSTSLDMQYETNLNNAALHGARDFPNIQLFGVSGNIVSSTNPNQDGTMFKLMLNIYDPAREQLVEGLLFPGNIARDKVVPTLQNLNDAFIFQLLYKRPPSADELQELQNAAEKF